MLNESLVDYSPIGEKVVASSFEPKVGKIKIHEHRGGIDAVYLQNEAGRVIAYITFKPYWGSENVMEVESFTNESVRNQGVQKRLNQELLKVLQDKGVEAIVGQIQIDNSASILNRCSVKSPNGAGVLRAEAMNIDWVDEEIQNGEKISPFSLELKVSLTEVVPNNDDLLQRIRTIQKSLTENRYNRFV